MNAYGDKPVVVTERSTLKLPEILHVSHEVTDPFTHFAQE